MNGFSHSAQIISRPSLTWRISLFIILTVVDIGFNTAAGAAAAATGAHVNSQSDSKTAHDVVNLSRVVGLGALGGLWKSGILAFIGFGKEFGGANLGMWLILALVGSTFGICVLVTSAISSLVLGDVPKVLLIAAIVTAIPLAGEMAGIQIAPDSHIATITSPGWNALAGYVFARMAHNGGLDICSYNAGAAAGAVYGALTCVKGLIVSCVKGPTTTHTVSNGAGSTATISNRFGTYTIYDPMGGGDMGMGMGGF